MAALLNAVHAHKFDLLTVIGHTFSALYVKFGAIAEYARKRAAYRQLLSLDDRMLADLGLERSEIKDAVFGGK